MLLQDPFLKACATFPRHRRPATALVALGLAFIGAARAADSRPPLAPQPMAFNIPAQPLASALHAYGQQLGVQVLYEAHTAAGLRSQAVQGRFAPEEALKRLLTGTDLEVRHVRPDAITLAPPQPSGQDAARIDPTPDADLVLGELRVRASARPNELERFAEYSEAVRDEVQRAVLGNAETARGNYRVVVDLWIGPSRTVRKAALQSSTGQDARDAAIRSTLQGLTINRPTPPSAPQPIRVVVAVSTPR